MVFANPFFSLKGQKERLTNVVNVLKQSLNPLSKAKPVANVSSKPLKRTLEFVAANPYTTAAIATGVTAAVRTPSAAVTSVARTIARRPKTAIAGTVIAGAAVTSSRVREVITGSASKLTPENLLNVGGRTGEVIETGIKQSKPFFEIIKDVSKPAAKAGIIGGAAALGVGAIAVVGNKLFNDDQKTNIPPAPSLINDIPETSTNFERPITPTIETLQPSEAGIPIDSGNAATFNTVTTGSPTKKKKKRKKKITQTIKISNRINLNNRNINKVLLYN